MGEVIAAADSLKKRGLSERGFHALVAIAEGCRIETRQGSVPYSRIQAGLFGASRSTAERAIRDLKTAGLIRVVKRGFNNHAGRACAPIYEIAILSDPVTWVTETVADRTRHPGDGNAGGEHVTQVTETVGGVPVTSGGRSRQIEGRPRHPSEVLPVSTTGSLTGARADGLPKCTGRDCRTCLIISQAIKICGDCDDFGRLADGEDGGPGSDCPNHGNFRRHVKRKVSA